MRNVYLSFLGAGNYEKTVYHLGGREASATRYVQCAEIDILGRDRFDICLFVVTPTSMEKHFHEVKEELNRMGISNILAIQINEELDACSQWQWFEKILIRIAPKDRLTIDMTHGYRAVPIVLSAAINFLQKAKNIYLDAVYYGAYEKDKTLSPIIDMKEFYIINEWAEAVSRLIEDADARKLAEIAEKNANNQMPELNDETIIRAFNDLTHAIRNVDINNVAHKANAALKLIRKKYADASPTGKILLDLVIDKFVSLSSDEPISGNYDRNYFFIQIEIIRLLLDHKLFMQAFTVMREFIGSIGLIEVRKANMRNSDGRKQRKKADIFLRMITNEESDWRFNDSDRPYVERVLSFYDKIKTYRIEVALRGFCRELTEYRNGFDHAWTERPEARNDIEEKGERFYQRLKEVVQKLGDLRILQ